MAVREVATCSGEINEVAVLTIAVKKGLGRDTMRQPAVWGLELEDQIDVYLPRKLRQLWQWSNPFQKSQIEVGE